MRLISNLILLLLIASSSPAVGPFRMDGQFDDWNEVHQVATDPKGDATGAFDLSSISAAMDGTTLWLRFDTGTKLNLPSGPESHGSLMLHLGIPSDRRLTIDLRGRQAILETKQSASTLTWADLEFALLPTYASNDFELRLDLKSFAVRDGDKLQLQFSGSDSLSEPVELEVPVQQEQTVAPVKVPNKPEGAIRVASLNTLHQGTADPIRGKLIRELFERADADVYCFNEEWDEEPFLSSVGNVLPDRADEWNIHWSRSRGIVSTLPMRPVEVNCPNATAATITTGQGKPIHIVSVHFDCCGHAGSEQDIRRIRQATQLVGDVKRLFLGKPIIVLGDYNLVGSRKPLRILEDAGLRPVMLRSLNDGSAITWQGVRPEETFWPGRLDYVTRSESVRVVGGFTLTTAELDGTQNRTFEQWASDHAMLVVDVLTN